MKYVVKMSGISLADANEVLRFCSMRGFGLPEITEERQAQSCPEPVAHRHRTRREIIMTAVSESGESFTGGDVEVAKHIAQHTGRGVSAAHMMSLFRRGEKFRGFSAIITKDSNRTRKDKSAVLPQLSDTPVEVAQ